MICIHFDKAFSDYLIHMLCLGYRCSIRVVYHRKMMDVSINSITDGELQMTSIHRMYEVWCDTLSLGSFVDVACHI